MRVIIGLVVCLTIVMHVASVSGRRIRKTCKPLNFPDTTSTCHPAAKADGRYPKGTICTFDCNEGCIRLQGVRQRVCKVKGRTKWWTGGRGLECECNPCESAPSLPEAEGSTKDCDPADPPFPAGSECIFDCMVGYNKTSGGTKLCKNGIWRGDDIVCEDIDGCDPDPCDANAQCTDNTAPDTGATCTCSTGYEGDGMTCTDIDGCDPDPCDANAQCTDNTAPDTGATCTCSTGYEGDGMTCTDIDGCDPDPCDANAQCTDNTAPDTGATCTCSTGYEGDGMTCTDIDGCDPDPCDANAQCTDNTAPDTGATCTCSTGYEGDGMTCTDIDGCDPDPCDANAQCTDNTAPDTGATCTCSTGYEGDGMTCTDIDGCDPDPCDANAQCTDNTAPDTGATCTCSTGYEGDGMTCTDIDGCDPDPCDANAQCTDNTAPDTGATCTCSTGYEGDGMTCTDIDGCDPDPCDANAQCTDNTAPDTGATCTCSTGYEGDGMTCTDIDGCDPDPCDANAQCTDNTAPDTGATCTCSTGYEGDGMTCTDIDGCDPDPCDANAQCTDNTAPDTGATCTCSTGYEGDGMTCTDIDGCDPDPCDANAQCTDNTAPDTGATCTCSTGYEGDGMTCTAGCSGRDDPPEGRRMVVFCSDSGPPYLLDTLCIHWCNNAGGFFRQSGAESRTCEAGGIWSGDDLVCVDHSEDPTVACSARDDPPEVQRGSVFCDNSGPLYKIGTLCIHSCNEADGFFQKSGDESRTCQVGGTWGGDDLVCADASTDPTVACGARTDPPEDERGSMYCTNSGPPYPIDTICINSCDSAGGFFPESGDEHRTCQVGGTWNGDDLICAEHGPDSNVACSDRTDPPEAERGNIMFCDQSGPPYPIGTVCTRSCDEAAGYFLNSGDEMRTCQGGAWDGAPLVCAADCAARTDPPEAERGTVFCDSQGPPYPIGTVCAHSCDNLGGYFISTGDTQRTCQVGGTWSGADLACYVPPI
ncbi:NOTCH2 [Branchiostoma lanceolatum]|uniref:NOTCH2 protein n=1 Tax=Branchiostoma lanceolatum TaxID=7740 RepID=A0A8J9ZL11_BRALA|nr:NOTCH2 [Branchiostoma lanceolatum]